jgi:hypothetical protein
MVHASRETENSTHYKLMCKLLLRDVSPWGATIELGTSSLSQILKIFLHSK